MRMKTERFLGLFLGGFILWGGAPCGLRGETNTVRAKPTAIDFNRDIRPILSNRCFKCHGPDLKKAGLDLQTPPAATKQLKARNFPVGPGKSAESQLIQRVSAPEEEIRMPPSGKGERLKPAEVAKLRTWIDQGAPYAEHWAYVTPQRPALPAVRNEHWVHNAIDYFV